MRLQGTCPVKPIYRSRSRVLQGSRPLAQQRQQHNITEPKFQSPESPRYAIQYYTSLLVSTDNKYKLLTSFLFSQWRHSPPHFRLCCKPVTVRIAWEGDRPPIVLLSHNLGVCPSPQLIHSLHSASYCIFLGHFREFFNLVLLHLLLSSNQIWRRISRRSIYSS